MTVTIFLVSLMGAMAIGVPVAFSLIICGIALMAYLGIYDSQIVAQKILDGADSFVLLAIPVLPARRRADERRRAVQADRQFRAGADRPPPRRPRLRGHRRRDHHGVAVRLGRRRHRGAGGDPDPDDARSGLQHPALGGADRRGRHRRAGDSAVDRFRRLRRGRQRVDPAAVHRRHRPRRPARPVAVRRLVVGVAQGGADDAAEAQLDASPAHVARRRVRAGDAGLRAGLDPLRLGDADRGRRGRRRLRVRSSACSSTRS